MFAKLIKSFSVVALGVASMSGYAAIVTQNGADVSFTYDDSTLFGAGTVVGNAIFFSPTNFSNESEDGATAGNVTDTLNITVNTLSGSGYVLDFIQTVESGDYILDGTTATVAASLRTQVTSNTQTDGLFPLTNIVLEQTGTINSPQDGSTNLWNLSNLNDWSWDNETSVNYQIQNNLLADTDQVGDYAFIQKKNQAVGIQVQVIPVPAAAWLFGSALMATGLIRRRTAS